MELEVVFQMPTELWKQMSWKADGHPFHLLIEFLPKPTQVRNLPVEKSRALYKGVLDTAANMNV